MHDSDHAVHVRITGRVQGVYFRAWTQQRAQALGLRGWVRNDPDGAVSALIEGPRAGVDAMLEALKDGPRAASVDTIERSEASPGAPAGFHITR